MGGEGKMHASQNRYLYQRFQDVLQNGERAAIEKSGTPRTVIASDQVVESAGNILTLCGTVNLGKEQSVSRFISLWGHLADTEFEISRLDFEVLWQRLCSVRSSS